MTNHGFHKLMAERGIRVLTTDVGDRYVLEALWREGGVLGGEQSGHVICLRDHVTGDGLAAALLLCAALHGPDAERGGGRDAALRAGEGEHPRRVEGAHPAALDGGRARQRRARRTTARARAAVRNGAARARARRGRRPGGGRKSLCSIAELVREELG